MKISQDLTYAELRMLYLLITKPNIIELPQQLFADIIRVHRRTINIGLKKLKELNYIHEINSYAEPSEFNAIFEGEEAAIKRHELATAKQVVENSFENYYATQDKTFIINEDYYSFILGDMRLPSKYRHSKSFVTEIVREKYPEIRFYFDLKKPSYIDDNHYNLMQFVNDEIIAARKRRDYHINIVKILQYGYDLFSIEKEEVLGIIKSIFPKIRLTDKHLSLRKPYKA